jgi:TP901 family phage tail tape measure protein
VSGEAARIFVEVGANIGEFMAKMGAVESRLGGVGQRMSSIGSTIMGAGKKLTTSVTLPLLAIGGAATKLSLDFAHSMNEIKALVGASDTQMARYKEAVLDMGRTMPQGPKALADALYFVTSSGFKGEAALRVLRASAKAAAAGLGDTKTVADAVTSAVNAYGEKALSAGRATDILLAAVREGKAEPEELAGAIGRVIAPAEAMKVEFGEVAGAVAALSMTGLDAAESVTAIRGVLMGLMHPAKSTREMLADNKISMDQLRDSVANKGLLPTLQMLRDRFGDNKDALGELFPNVRALNGFLALTGANAEKNANVMGKVANAHGDTARAFAKAMTDNENKIRAAFSSIQVSAIKLGGILAPIVANVAARVADVASAFSNLSPSAQKAILVIAGIAAAIGPLLVMLGAMVAGIGAVVAIVAFLLSPIGLVVIAIAALVGVLVYLAMTNENVRAKLASAWNAISSGIGSAVGYVKQKWAEMASWYTAHAEEIRQVTRNLMTAIRAVFEAVWPVIATIFKAYWNVIKAEVQTAMNVIRDVVRLVSALIRGDWGAAWAAMKALVSDVLHGVVAIIRATLTGAVQIVAALAAAIGRALWAGIKAGAAALANLASWLLGRIGAAIAAVAAWAAGAAVAIGRGIVDGITSGIGDLAGNLAGKLKGAVSGALGSVKGAFGIHSPSKTTHDEIGKPLGDGVIEGFLFGLRDLPSKVNDKIRTSLEQVRATVEGMQSTFGSAFGRLGDYALKAFDAKTSAMTDKLHAKFDGLRTKLQEGFDAATAKIDLTLNVKLAGIEDWQRQLTPAEQMLKDLEDRHSEEGRQEAIGDAQKQLTEAQATGDPEKILAAQKALDAALYQEQIATLQKQAAAERAARDQEADEKKKAAQQAAEDAKAHLEKTIAEQQKRIDLLEKEQAKQMQAQRDLKRQHLEDQLADLQKYLDEHPKKWKALHKRLTALMKGFGVTFKASGKELGNAFADGMKEAFDNVEKTAKAIAKLVAKYLELHSPAEAGPLASLDKWWEAFTPTLLRGFDLDSINAKMDGLGMPGGAAPFALAGAGRGAQVIRLENHTHTYLDGKEIAHNVRDELVSIGRRGSTVLSGVGVAA